MDVTDTFSNEDESRVGNFYCQSTVELQNALKASVVNILNRVTDDIFIDIYKNGYKGFEKKTDIERASLSGSSAEAKNYRKQFNDIVMENISETIDETILTMMDSKLKDLEDMKKDQTDTSLVWRPPSDAEKHMIPFNNVSKVEERKELLNEIEKENEVVKLLKARVVKKRLKAKELHNVLQNSLKKIESLMVVAVKENEKI